MRLTTIGFTALTTPASRNSSAHAVGPDVLRCNASPLSQFTIRYVAEQLEVGIET
jgi:hypothetical protein